MCRARYSLQQQQQSSRCRDQRAATERRWRWQEEVTAPVAICDARRILAPEAVVGIEQRKVVDVAKHPDRWVDVLYELRDGASSSSNGGARGSRRSHRQAQPPTSAQGAAQIEDPSRACRALTCGRRCGTSPPTVRTRSARS